MNEYLNLKPPHAAQRSHSFLSFTPYILMHLRRENNDELATV